jgi:hypothetical protein
MIIKERLEDYTEKEFLEQLDMLFNPPPYMGPDQYEQHVDNFVHHFRRLTEHPEASDLIFYPAKGISDSPEGILQSVKEWRAENGKPGFKPELADH